MSQHGMAVPSRQGHVQRKLHRPEPKPSWERAQQGHRGVAPAHVPARARLHLRAMVRSLQETVWLGTGSRCRGSCQCWWCEQREQLFQQPPRATHKQLREAGHLLPLWHREGTAGPRQDTVLTGVTGQKCSHRESPGTSTRKGQAGLGELWGRGSEPRDVTPSSCDRSKAGEHTSARRSTRVQPGKENMAPTDPSPLCQLPCFPADLLFPHSITAQ